MMTNIFHEVMSVFSAVCFMAGAAAVGSAEMGAAKRTHKWPYPD